MVSCKSLAAGSKSRGVASAVEPLGPSTSVATLLWFCTVLYRDIVKFENDKHPLHPFVLPGGAGMTTCNQTNNYTLMVTRRSIDRVYTSMSVHVMHAPVSFDDMVLQCLVQGMNKVDQLYALLSAQSFRIAS